MSQLLATNPRQVTAVGGKVNLVVMNSNDSIPATFALMATKANAKVAIRISGGCKGMSVEDQHSMLEYFAAAFRGYQGVIFGGGTRDFDGDGQIKPMVTEIPGVIAAQNPGVIALGTLPRTAMMHLKGDTAFFQVDEWGAGINLSQEGVLIVQKNPDANLGWNGDVATYFELMKYWGDYAGFTALGVIAWNGGAVTEEEIMMSANIGWPTVLAEGSGRAADEILDKLAAQDAQLLEALPTNHCIVGIKKDDPGALRSYLDQNGFFPEV